MYSLCVNFLSNPFKTNRIFKFSIKLLTIKTGWSIVYMEGTSFFFLSNPFKTNRIFRKITYNKDRVVHCVHVIISKKMLFFL